MSIFLFLVAGGLLVLLLMTAAVRPVPASESLFELRRRQRLRDERASRALRRQTLLAQAEVLDGPSRSLLLILLTAILIYLVGWVGGLFCALLVGVVYGRFAELTPIRKIANKVYRRNEDILLDLVSKYKKTIRFIGGKKVLEEDVVPLGSKEELIHLLELSPIFSDDEKQLLERTLRFKGRTVKELMTPKNKVVTVADTELLGPLVLDDLHKTGHTIFPVVKGEAVVGLLDSSDHADLHTKESVHVRSVMHTDIGKVEEEASLNDALRVLLVTKDPLLIVEDGDAQMTGIVSLKDIIRAIVGRE